MRRLTSTMLVAGRHRKLASSSSDSFHSVAHSFQHSCKPLPLIALDLDAAILHRPAGATLLLQRAGEFQQARFVQRNVEYGRHAFATPPLRFPADFHGDRFLGWFYGWFDLFGCRQFSPSTEDAGHKAHDFTFNPGECAWRIVNVPEFDLIGPGRKSLLHQG